MGFSLQGKWSFKWFFRLLVSINIHYLPNWYTFNWKIKNLTIWSTRALFSSLIIFFFKMGQLRPLFRLFLVFSSKQYNSDNKSKKMFTQYTAPGFEPTTFLTWVVTRPIKWYFLVLFRCAKFSHLYPTCWRHWNISGFFGQSFFSLDIIAIALKLTRHNLTYLNRTIVT